MLASVLLVDFTGQAVDGGLRVARRSGSASSTSRRPTGRRPASTAGGVGVAAVVVGHVVRKALAAPVALERISRREPLASVITSAVTPAPAALILSRTSASVSVAAIATSTAVAPALGVKLVCPAPQVPSSMCSVPPPSVRRRRLHAVPWRSSARWRASAPRPCSVPAAELLLAARDRGARSSWWWSGPRSSCSPAWRRGRASSRSRS